MEGFGTVRRSKDDIRDSTGIKKVIFKKKKKWKIAEPTPLAAFERIQASDE